MASSPRPSPPCFVRKRGRKSFKLRPFLTCGATNGLNVRLQKFLAEAGVASRRASEQIILDGRVSVNGRTVREMGSKVDPAHDKVTVDGTLVRKKRKLYVALNKPPGYVCSQRDE